MKPAKVGCVLVIATAILIALPTVLAALVAGGEAQGSTEITSISCSADVFGVVAPTPLNVNNGDDVRFYFNVSWSDTRSSGSPTATHEFYLKAQWATTEWVEDTKTVLTTGSSSGSDNRFVTVPTVNENYVIVVTWRATLSAGPTCIPSDEEVRTVTLS